jgi:hypothetical protein
MYIEQPREMVPPLSDNTVRVFNQITLPILYYINSRLVTLPEFTDAPIKVSDIFNQTLSFQLINFSFQVCLLFVPEMSVIFTSYIV